MKTTFLSIFAAIMLSVVVSGCTSQQAYGGGQAWQRNECNKMIDENERERCLKSAEVSYEDYKRATHDDKK